MVVHQAPIWSHIRNNIVKTKSIVTSYGDRSFSAADPQVWNGLPSALRTWCLTVLNEDLRPICLHLCDDISAPCDYWFLALYKYSLCVYVVGYKAVSILLCECQIQQEVKVIWEKAPHGGHIPRLGVTPGGRKLYHWIPGVGFPILPC